MPKSVMIKDDTDDQSKMKKIFFLNKTQFKEDRNYDKFPATSKVADERSSNRDIKINAKVNIFFIFHFFFKRLVNPYNF